MTASGHAKRVQAAKEAIDAVFSDQSVDWRTTLESMEDLVEAAQGPVDTLREEHRAELED